MHFQAFISYKHEDSSVFAARLEAALKSYAKPVFKRPPKIFRDEKHLTPGSDLPDLIRRALEDSKFLILLASPAAANSPWVQDELRHWCDEMGRADYLIIVLTQGTIATDDETQTIDWDRTTALPEVLQAHVQRAPLYVDLSWATSDTDLSLVNAKFKHAVNSIVARLRGIDPNDMLGEEVRQHRRTIRLRNSAIVLLLAGLVGTLYFLREANQRAADYLQMGRTVLVDLHGSMRDYGNIKGRRHVAEKTVELLSSLIGSRHGAEGARLMAMGHQRAAETYRESGKLELATKHYEKARDIALADDDADRRNETLSIVCLGLARIAIDQADTSSARKLLDQALRHAEECAGNSYESVEPLVNAYFVQGKWHQANRESKQAVGSFQKARDALANLGPEQKETSRYHRTMSALLGAWCLALRPLDLGRAIALWESNMQHWEKAKKLGGLLGVQVEEDELVMHAQLGELHVSQQKPKLAITSFLKAASMARELVRAEPWSSRARELMAQNYYKAARHEAELGEERAIEHSTAAILQYDALLRMEPGHSDWSKGLIFASMARAEAYLEKKKLPEAAADAMIADELITKGIKNGSASEYERIVVLFLRGRIDMERKEWSLAATSFRAAAAFFAKSRKSANGDSDDMFNELVARKNLLEALSGVKNSGEWIREIHEVRRVIAAMSKNPRAFVEPMNYATKLLTKSLDDSTWGTGQLDALQQARNDLLALIRKAKELGATLLSDSKSFLEKGR